MTKQPQDQQGQENPPPNRRVSYLEALGGNFIYHAMYQLLLQEKEYRKAQNRERYIRERENNPEHVERKCARKREYMRYWRERKRQEGDNT